jgi:hypothetical protein
LFTPVVAAIDIDYLAAGESGSGAQHTAIRRQPLPSRCISNA